MIPYGQNISFCQTEEFPFEGSLILSVEKLDQLKMLVPPHAGTPIINQSTNVQKLYGRVQVTFLHGLFEQGFYRTT